MPYIAVVTIVILQRMSSFDIGVTTRDPQFGLPKDLEEIENSKEFFVYRDGLTMLSHCGVEKEVPFYYHPQTSIGCSIKDGKLFIYSNGEEMGVAREGLDRDQPYWAWTFVPYGYSLVIDYLYSPIEGKNLTYG